MNDEELKMPDLRKDLKDRTISDNKPDKSEVFVGYKSKSGNQEKKSVSHHTDKGNDQNLQ